MLKRRVGMSKNDKPYSLHFSNRNTPHSRDISSHRDGTTTSRPDKDLDAPPSSSDSEDELTLAQHKVEEGEESMRESPRKRQKTTHNESKPTSKVKSEGKEEPTDDLFQDQPIFSSRASKAKFGKGATTYGKRDKVKHEEKGRRKGAGFQKPATLSADKTPPKPDPGAGFQVAPTLPKPNPAAGFQAVPKAPERDLGKGLQKPPSVRASGVSKSDTRKSNRKKKGALDTTKPAASVFKILETGAVLKNLGIDISKADIDGEDPLPEIPTAIDTVSGSSSPLSVVSSDHFDSDVSKSFDPLQESSQSEMNPTKVCPVCKAKVLASTIRQFKETLSNPPKGDHLSTRQQVQFCRYHKKNTARAQWKMRKYPEIDWDILPDRISRLRSDVDSIIDGSVDSFYADKVLGAQKPAVGGRRQRVMDEFEGVMGDENAGYYGGQGARIIGEEVARICSSSLGKSKDNKAIAAAGGIGAYIQMVIVPEVASRLVAEDMKCDLPRAQELLIEGAELGRQLCEELDDEVHEDEDVQMHEGNGAGVNEHNEEDDDGNDN